MLNTAQKMVLAKIILSGLLLLGIKPYQVVSRQGVKFDLDLHEGIDLSLFLFGFFQQHVLTAIKRYVPEDGIVIDVGANIGAIALPMANTLSRGHVYAIEPTEYAFSKLNKNISLNPHLAARISTIQTFVADQSSEHSSLVAYSSWLLTNSPTGSNRHPVHKGIPMAAICGQLTLDELIAGQKINKVSLIKIDTDGHEYKVLNGAGHCIDRFRPLVIFEATEYMMRPPNPTFQDFERFFKDHSYRMYLIGSPVPIAASTFEKKCPRRGSLDLLAVPDERSNSMGWKS